MTTRTVPHAQTAFCDDHTHTLTAFCDDHTRLALCGDHYYWAYGNPPALCEEVDCIPCVPATYLLCPFLPVFDRSWAKLAHFVNAAINNKPPNLATPNKH